MMPETNTDQVTEYKKMGNEAFKKKQYKKAVENYNKALELGVKGQPAAAIYSNLANVHTKLKEYDAALESSKLAIEMDSKWKKGYYWKGVSHLYLKNFEDASSAFQNGSVVDEKDNEFKEKLKAVEFCKENEPHLNFLDVTDWLIVAKNTLSNLQALSTELLAKSLCRLTMKTKLGYKLTQCALMDLQGQLILKMVPVNAITPADKIVSEKIRKGELVKLYVIAFVNENELPSLSIMECQTPFSNLQQTVIKIMVEYSKKKSFNEHFFKYL
ncbi:heat shock protein STI1-like [Anneissia japonica]|uniref:heat shock protein STI1-like n=1 Tax=Anneissia japonica TaxID=1529436 RepID=UPI00142553FB|nr:heat shock protein STI1-like [Anneissia japonica]